MSMNIGRRLLNSGISGRDRGSSEGNKTLPSHFSTLPDHSKATKLNEFFTHNLSSKTKTGFFGSADAGKVADVVEKRITAAFETCSGTDLVLCLKQLSTVGREVNSDVTGPLVSKLMRSSHFQDQILRETVSSTWPAYWHKSESKSGPIHNMVMRETPKPLVAYIDGMIKGDFGHHKEVVLAFSEHARHFDTPETTLFLKCAIDSGCFGEDPDVLGSLMENCPKSVIPTNKNDDNLEEKSRFLHFTVIQYVGSRMEHMSDRTLSAFLEYAASIPNPDSKAYTVGFLFDTPQISNSSVADALDTFLSSLETYPDSQLRVRDDYSKNPNKFGENAKVIQSHIDSWTAKTN